MPGLVAYRENVLGTAGVALRLAEPEKGQWDAYQNSHKQLADRIDSINAQIVDKATPSAAIPGLITLKNELSAELHAKPPLSLFGMEGDWLNEIWFISYLSLGLLIALWAYPLTNLRWKNVLGWTVLVYCCAGTLTYVRNFVLNRPGLGRTTYYWVNWEISKTSYVLQDLRQLGMYFLICTFWQLAARRLEIVDAGIHSNHDKPKDSIDAALEALKVFREALSLWQVSTLLILLIFVPRNVMYWNLIASQKDARYLPSVLLVDILWIVTWFAAGRPLLLATRNWNARKLGLIATWAGEAAPLNALLAEASNSSDWQVMIAGLTAVGSVLFPIIKALL
ncbi:hypothetical protein [Acidicapsa acidisoli]|uniref:hypothetical protein n=1 Tax=Acidicapsa acidisoli TaxID=1615681 RepID=UPI0021E005E7|nr:hypothetical protein [Acidicapsa acidisoli]